jgi:hypothetical protein
MPHKLSNPIARDACLRATVIELHREADELTGLCRKPEPPALPDGSQTQRERLLLDALEAERQRSARLLELLSLH